MKSAGDPLEIIQSGQAVTDMSKVSKVHRLYPDLKTNFSCSSMIGNGISVIGVNMLSQHKFTATCSFLLFRTVEVLYILCF